MRYPSFGARLSRLTAVAAVGLITIGALPQFVTLAATTASVTVTGSQNGTIQTQLSTNNVWAGSVESAPGGQAKLNALQAPLVRLHVGDDGGAPALPEIRSGQWANTGESRPFQNLDTLVTNVFTAGQQPLMNVKFAPDFMWSCYPNSVGVSANQRPCAICFVDPETGKRGTNATNRICPKCRLDPANVDWTETVEDRDLSPRFGTMEEFLFQNIRRIVREEVRGAIADLLPKHAGQKESGAGYLSISEAAEIAGMHHSTLREWIKDGSLKAFRAGRVYRIRRADLDERLTAKVAEPVSDGIEKRVSVILAKRRLRAA